MARNVFSGFPDQWVLNYYMNNAAPRLELKLPRPEVVKHIGLALNCDYAPARQVNLYFDDDPKPVVLKTKPDRSRQEFDLTPRQASRLVIELAEFKKDGGPTGLAYVRLDVERSPEWHKKVKPLLSIGGLVKYPMGGGGVVLNQLLIKPAEENPVNAQKKSNIVVALLRNLHATFDGGRVLTTANLKYQPLPLDEQCNQYLSNQRGWFGGTTRDLSFVPVGTQTLGGVSYVIRDHRTSPVPSCVMLNGPFVRGKLPAAVKGLRAGCKADVLFFLHTFYQTAPGWARLPRDQPPAMVFKYVLHYADGKTADVPVRFSQGVDNWTSKSPAGLKDAALAWARAVPGGQVGRAGGAVFTCLDEPAAERDDHRHRPDARGGGRRRGRHAGAAGDHGRPGRGRRAMTDPGALITPPTEPDQWLPDRFAIERSEGLYE